MKLSGWGRYPTHEVEQIVAADRDALAKQIIDSSSDLIAFGQGRSYGDSALAPTLFKTNNLNRFIAFDQVSGILHAEAGISLSTILSVFIPKGFFVPVTPGTKYVTLGGMIASDVHGKNHHIDGSFMRHVLFIDLMLASGEVVRCSQSEHPALFHATCGGMGLTGIILSAAIQLVKIASTTIQQTTIKTQHLSETLELFLKHHEAKYSVAWLDCFAKKQQLGRSLLMLGQLSETGSLNFRMTNPKNLPITLLSKLLGTPTLKLFNILYYHRQLGRQNEMQVNLNNYFYPLDSIAQWNGLYGKQGFLQYQFVLPLASSHTGLQTILTEIKHYGDGSFLSVLKLFGPSSEGYLSFPMRGFTLALDFRVKPELFPFLDRLDSLVLEYGGKVYLTKDARLAPTIFQKMYPRFTEFMQIRAKYGADKKFNSFQSRRLGL